MPIRSARCHLSSPEATSAFAHSIGQALVPGDVLLLAGGIGAGKTHFARSLIQSLLLYPEDVPSPTFTLVQEYDTRNGPLWHADLYRLGGPDGCVELGLTDAFTTAICLVEWPDRLGDLRPETALGLHLEAGDDAGADAGDHPGDDAGDDAQARDLTLTWQDPRWDDVVARVLP